MPLELSSAVHDALLAEALAAGDEECCGLLLGSGNRIDAHRPAANVHPSPARHFEISPAVLIAMLRGEREGGPRIAGYYHSHPGGPCAPSATDSALAPRDGRIWAIVTMTEVALWRDCDDGFKPLPYRLVKP